MGFQGFRTQVLSFAVRSQEIPSQLWGHEPLGVCVCVFMCVHEHVCLWVYVFVHVQVTIYTQLCMPMYLYECRHQKKASRVAVQAPSTLCF